MRHKITPLPDALQDAAYGENPRTLTVAMVQEGVRAIAAVAHDDECAHGMEDDLREVVLRCIAAGRARNPRACAAAALSTEELDFDRWAG